MKEITPEIKAKIMSSYLGEYVEYIDIDRKNIIAKLTSVGTEYIETTYKRKRSGCSGDILSFKSNGHHNCDALHTALLLNPLSSISDEDAIEVSVLCGRENVSSGYAREFIQSYFETACATTAIYNYQFFKSIDFLRSRGYALGYLHWSVDDLVQAGVFKLKS